MILPFKRFKLILYRDIFQQYQLSLTRSLLELQLTEVGENNVVLTFESSK